MTWKTVKLGEVCKFQGGSQPAKSKFIYTKKEGYIRFLQIRDFKSDKNITYIPNSNKNKICKESDILIGRYGASVGKILSGKSGAYNVALMKTFPDEKLILKKWLYIYLCSNLFQQPLIKISNRAAQNGFSRDDIFNFKFPLPALTEQKKIIFKLDSLEKEILILKKNNDLKIYKLEKLLSALYEENLISNKL